MTSEHFTGRPPVVPGLSTLDDMVMELPDPVQRELHAIELELIEKMERETRAARVYAVRYAKDGTTSAHRRDDAAPFSKRIVNAFRVDAGQPANPFNPAQAGLQYWLFDRLLGDKFVTVETLHAEAKQHKHVGYGKFQVEPLLASRLADSWFELEKGKVAGKVAYRIRERDEAARTIGGHNLTCSRAGVLTVTAPDGRTVSVLPNGTHAALDVLGEPMKRSVVAWWKQVRS